MGKLLLALAAPRTCSLPGQEGAAWTGFKGENCLGWSRGGKFEATTAFLLGWGRLFMVQDLVPHLPIALGEIANPSSPAAAFMRLGLSPH